MRKLAELDNITYNWIDLDELNIFLTWSSIELGGTSLSWAWSSRSRSTLSLIIHGRLLSICHLYLTILAVYLMGYTAFKWHVRETTTHDTLNLLNQFFLELILDFFFFNVNLWDRIRAHELIDYSIWKYEVKLTLLLKFFCIYLRLLEATKGTRSISHFWHRAFLSPW
jgi:hypothetical protein